MHGVVPGHVKGAPSSPALTSRTQNQAADQVASLGGAHNAHGRVAAG